VRCAEEALAPRATTAALLPVAEPIALEHPDAAQALLAAEAEGPKTMRIDAPTAGLSRDPLTGTARATWFSSRTDTYGEISTPIDVAPAFIRVIPSPSSSGVLGLACVSIRRRRTTV
jgi:hypothetical protein